MKWTRFEQEFQDGTLNRFLKPGDIFNSVGPNFDVTKDQNVVALSRADDIVDSSFRIYRVPFSSFDQLYLPRYASAKSPHQFHKWHQEKCLPKEYFDPIYFTQNFLGAQATHFKSHAFAYDHKIDRTSVYGPRNYARPHPYEIYIGGWVHFYDTEIRHGDTDHAIYFEWDLQQNSVTTWILQTKAHVQWNVYVNIASPPTSTDPPPPKSGQPPC